MNVIGSQDVAVSESSISKYHFTHILNVSASNIPELYEHITYKAIKILDIPETNIVSYFSECFLFIDAALSINGHILVHCNAGVSRSASIVIGYLMKIQGISYEDAYKHVKSLRSAICPNQGFVKQLRLYVP